MAPRLSVVVPTYEEAANVRPLCTRLFAACRKANLEVDLLFVDDDSGEGTAQTVKAVEALKQEGFVVAVHVRARKEGKGLSSAVLLGLHKAKGDAMLVMDADLQHEPESVPQVAAPVLEGRAEFSVGSRHVSGGAVAQDWPLSRRIISMGATLLARPLTPCTDPMSGFFCISRKAFERAVKAELNPMGYKIGLELMVRSRSSKVVEVPITFRDREHGESKLTMKQNLLYLGHLAHLYRFCYPTTVVSILLVLALVGGYVLGHVPVRKYYRKWFLPRKKKIVWI